MANDMSLAHMYNQTTGANVTHRDVQSWGFLEAEVIRNAMVLINDDELLADVGTTKAHGDDSSSN